jgi:hypothetical protein
MVMGRRGAASLASGRTTLKAGHLGVRGGLVDEDDPRRIEVDEGAALILQTGRALHPLP